MLILHHCEDIFTSDFTNCLFSIVMKKLFLFTAALACAVLPSCKNNGQTPETVEITVTPDNASLAPDEVLNLEVSVIPEDTPLDDLTFKSSDENVATVTPDGTVTAVSAGSAVITATLGNASDECTINVSEGATVESVVITPADLALAVGESATLTAEVLPEQIEVVWSSTNTDVATVDENGKVTGVASGFATIMASAGGKSGQCNVSVSSVPVESIQLDVTSLDMKEGEFYTISATVYPENADSYTIKWTSSNENTATVNGAGRVSALRGGEAVITASVGDVKAECNVSVTGTDLSIGDFLYSDGTWSPVVDDGKEIIGVVFYVGDVTAQDKILAQDHPGCFHGLAVALEEVQVSWQANRADYNNTVNEWLSSNTEGYEDICSGLELEDNINKCLGYNNTRAIELFNAAPENQNWKVEAVDAIAAYEEDCPAPESTSGWYLPSAKELSILVSGETDQNIWIENGGLGVKSLTDINTRIELVDGATKLGGTITGFTSYMSSNEFDDVYAFGVNCTMGTVVHFDKNYNTSLVMLRPVIAF